MKRIAVVLVMVALLLTFAFPSTHIVGAQPPNLNGGVLFAAPGGTSATCTSWADACDLQTALGLAAAGDEIWAQTGTYKPTAGTDSATSFVLKSGVAIYGGFLGSETARDQRNWQANQTILSGEIGNPSVKTDNTFHVVRANGVDASALLDGFSIVDGYTSYNDPDARGGGFYCTNGASPTLENLIFQDNHSRNDGGGMYNNASAPTLTNVSFLNNSAATLGGGMANDESNPVLIDVLFQGNSGGYAGGMYNDTSSPYLKNVIFENNIASLRGGGMSNWYSSFPYLDGVDFIGNSASTVAGAMHNFNSSPVIKNSSFTGNSSADGGAMYNQGASGGTSNPKLINVTFEGNTATAGDGGAVYNELSTPTFKNVTIHANTSVNRNGGGIYNASSSPVFEDVTFSNNTSHKAGGGMYNYGTYTIPSSPSLLRVTFIGNVASDVMYGDGGGMFNYDWCSPTLTDVVFQSNSAGNDGGGMYNNQATFAVLRRVLFAGNFSDNHGGGLFNTAAYPDMENVTFDGNTSNENGGGMCSWAVISPLNMKNVTFVNNNTVYGDGGGIFNSTNNGFALRNAILWGNVPTQIVGGGFVDYSIVQGGHGGTGNLDLDPQLLPSANNGGYTKTLALQPGSPAIDAGDPDVCPLADQRGFLRPIDGDGLNGPRCDMGAYEFASYPESRLFLPMLLK